MPITKLTETSLAALPAPTAKAQSYYWDADLPGFGVVIGRTGRRTFVVRGRTAGMQRKVTIGVAGRPREDGHLWTAQLARIEARKLLGAMAIGKEPITPRLAAIAGQRPSLREALDFHIEKMKRGENRRGKVCSKRSIDTIRNTVEHHLAAWLDRPLVSITADVLDGVRLKIEQTTARREGSNPKNPPGRAVANRLLSNVSTIWRSWSKRHGISASCPVDRLIAGALKARDNRISNAELPAWHAKVQTLASAVRRDLHLVALFTGVRTDGVRNLRWEDLDFRTELIHIARAKGDRPYALPMCKTVREVLEARRRANAETFASIGGDQGVVFPSMSRDGRRVVAIGEVNERRAITNADGSIVRENHLPGVQACRKTFNSVAIEIGIPREAREALMNHEGRGVNVKSYGFPQNWDYLKECAAKIEAALWERIGVKTEGQR